MNQAAGRWKWLLRAVALGSIICVLWMVWISLPNVEFLQLYRKIEVGMTMREVESILGPGKRISKQEIPQTKDESRKVGTKPVVFGDAYLRWDHDQERIIIGFQDGKVVCKDYWEPSL